MMTSAKPLDIITIGGSISGLMASIPLLRLGHNVTVLERSPTPVLHDQGAGMNFGEEAREFMRHYDKTRSFMSCKTMARVFLRKDGSIERILERDEQLTSWDLVYHVCRANFDGLVSEYIAADSPLSANHQGAEGEGKAVYRHGCLVTDVHTANNGVQVTYRSTLDGHDPEVTHCAQADFLVIAEGASSLTRRLVSPTSKPRTYAGYVAFRGTVPESDLNIEAKKIFIEKFPFYFGDNSQILGYIIPGHAGSLAPGQRLVNWVWYFNVAHDSAEYREIMTDRTGKVHRWTLPPGGTMRADVWERQKERARAMLPFQFVQLIEQTKFPFLQAVTDLEPTGDGKCWYLDGKAVLVGDALAGFRPHTAASTMQAALHALLLPKVFVGELDTKAYEERVVEYATTMQRRGVMMGEKSQFGKQFAEL